MILAPPRSLRRWLRPDLPEKQRQATSAPVYGRTVGGLVGLGRVALAIASGVLLTATFGPEPRPWLGFVAFVPLILACYDWGIVRSALAGWLAGIIASATIYGWIPAYLDHTQAIDASHRANLYILVLAYHALPLALFAAGASFVRAGVRRAFLVDLEMSCGWGLASWWVFIEWLFPTPLGWHLGHAFTPIPSIRQGIDLLGVYGLSYFAMLINVWCANLIGTQMLAWRRIRLAMVGSSLVGLAIVYGAYSPDFPIQLPQEPFNVTILQPGETAPAPDADESVWQWYEEQTRAAATGTPDHPPAQLVVWPETALRRQIRNVPSDLERVSRLAREAHVPVLLGAVDANTGASEELDAAFMVLPEPRRARWTFMGLRDIPAFQPYHKRFLVPFHDYLPWYTRLLRLDDWRGAASHGEGELRWPFWIADEVIVAPAIGSEARRSGVVNELVAGGAGFIVNLADDADVADDAEAKRRWTSMVGRAVEVRRWIVSASGAGSSAIIDARGEVVASLPRHQRGVLHHTIRVRHDSSTFLFLGHAILLFVLGDLFWFGMRLRSENIYGQDELKRRYDKNWWHEFLPKDRRPAPSE